MGAPKNPRKKAPRNKSDRKNPKVSERLKELWQTPEYRARMDERDRQVREVRAHEPWRYSRAGVPDGMSRATVKPLWDRAAELADKFVQVMKDTGQLEPVEHVMIDIDQANGTEVTVAVPNTDAGKAEAALREAFILAVGPANLNIKVQAINTVLAYTKSKPESKAKLTLDRAEDFLDAVAADLGGNK